MYNVRVERSAGYAGSAFVVIPAIGLFLYGIPPLSTWPAGAIADFVLVHRGLWLFGAWLTLPESAFFFWFIVQLRAYLRMVPGLDDGLPSYMLMAGVAAGIMALAPFGAGNPRPVFAARGVEIIDGPRKLKERHLKMSLKQEGRIFRAVAWRAAERHDFLTEHKAALDVAFSLEQNHYNGNTYVELTLADLKSSGS